MILLFLWKRNCLIQAHVLFPTFSRVVFCSISFFPPTLLALLSKKIPIKFGLFTTLLSLLSKKIPIKFGLFTTLLSLLSKKIPIKFGLFTTLLSLLSKKIPIKFGLFTTLLSLSKKVQFQLTFICSL